MILGLFFYLTEVTDHTGPLGGLTPQRLQINKPRV